MKLSLSGVIFFIGSLIFTFQVSAQQKITLDEVIAAVLEKNYDIQLAHNNAQATSVDDRFAFGAFLPQVNATGSMLWSTPDQNLKFKDPSRNVSGSTKSDNTSGSVLLNWTLFDGTKMFATRMRVAAIARQGEILVKDQMVNTISSVIVNYYNVVRQKQQLNAIKELMAVNEERVKLADRKLSVGVGGKPELLQAKVDLNAQKTQVLQQETAIAVLKEQLNVLTGMSLPVPYDVSDSIGINLDLKLEDLSEDIESNNFSLQASKLNLVIANKTLHERKAAFLPTISVNGAYNYSKTNNTILLNPFGTIFSQTNGFNYGLTVALPVLNGLNNHRLTEQARIGASRQQLLFEQQKLGINVGIRNAFTTYENAKAILLVEEENILLARENVKIALESFKRGISTFIELRTAQQSLSDAYNRLIAARYNAKTSETELLRLRGALLH